MLDRPWVVTGAAGYLGSHVTEQLLSRGIPVVAVDNFSGGRREYVQPHLANPRFKLEELDIRNSAALTAAFKRHEPTAVVHLAALHFIPAAIADPPLAVSLNVHGTQCVLSAARAVNTQRVWFASTGDVYAPSEQPHKEEQERSPFNIYGLTKSIGEQLIALESRIRPDAHFFIGRLFNLYGPRETNPHILPEILGQVKLDRTKPLRLGNMWPRRDLVPVVDAARAVIESTLNAPRGVSTMNVATGVAISMEEVVNEISRALGGGLRVETDPAKVRPVERNHLQADVTRLRSLIGWTPHGDIKRGIRELLVYEQII